MFCSSKAITSRTMNLRKRILITLYWKYYGLKRTYFLVKESLCSYTASINIQLHSHKKSSKTRVCQSRLITFTKISREKTASTYNGPGFSLSALVCIFHQYTLRNPTFMGFNICARNHRRRYATYLYDDFLQILFSIFLSFLSSKLAQLFKITRLFIFLVNFTHSVRLSADSINICNALR